MEPSIQYPTWKTVGVPESILEIIRNSDVHSLISYLAINRVFRFHVKPQYLYNCPDCGSKKIQTRVYEEYLFCEACGRKRLLVTPQWRMGKDQCHRVDDTYAGLAIQQMYQNHINYFGEPPPEEFFSCGWKFQTSPKPKGVNANDLDGLGTPPVCSVQFYSGDVVQDYSQTTATLKAAILTPFLWDDRFDWRFLISKEETQETHFIPLIQMVLKMGGYLSLPSAFKKHKLDLNLLPLPGHDDD